jgi:hypothetical protein
MLFALRIVWYVLARLSCAAEAWIESSNIKAKLVIGNTVLLLLVPFTAARWLEHGAQLRNVVSTACTQVQHTFTLHIARSQQHKTGGLMIVCYAPLIASVMPCYLRQNVYAVILTLTIVQISSQHKFALVLAALSTTPSLCYLCYCSHD